MGYKLIWRIMTGVFVVWMLLQLVILRDTPYPMLKTVLGYAFIFITVVLFILLFLNRYKP